MRLSARIALYCLVGIVLIITSVSQIARLYGSGSRFAASTFLGLFLAVVVVLVIYLSFAAAVGRMLSKVRKRNRNGVQILFAADERLWEPAAPTGPIPRVRYGVMDASPDGLRFFAGVNDPQVRVFIAAPLVERMTVGSGRLGLRRIRSLEVRLRPGASTAPLICFPIRPTFAAENPSILQHKFIEAQKLLTGALN
ncbi:hypothetical protein [Leifsonia sp. NPDC058230]|uniref:hypothetical protein n=1 Tax=Leifsonia sp. NPDC058230 TaxID=3346391 RepID=UPI0036DAE453